MKNLPFWKIHPSLKWKPQCTKTPLENWKIAKSFINENLIENHDLQEAQNIVSDQIIIFLPIINVTTAFFIFLFFILWMLPRKFSLARRKKNRKKFHRSFQFSLTGCLVVFLLLLYCLKEPICRCQDEGKFVSLGKVRRGGGF